jgi:hypothetical protein
MVDYNICSDHIGIFRSHLPIFCLGVRRILCPIGSYSTALPAIP